MTEYQMGRGLVSIVFHPIIGRLRTDEVGTKIMPPSLRIERNSLELLDKVTVFFTYFLM